MGRLSTRPGLLILAFVCVISLPGVAQALEKATLQLKWLHHFQFAGYYAALEKGFYREAGLDVTIVEGGPSVEVEKEVLQGRANFGVGTSALLLHLAHGDDLVSLGQIFQHSPAVFLTPRKTGIHSVREMAGRRFMYSNQHGDMLALLKKNGIEESGIVQVPHQGDPHDLIAGKADVMIAYSFNEPFVLEQVGEPYLTFSPMTSGIDFYGDNFFTTRKTVNARPEFVEAFRRATLRGWRYALDNKVEIVDLIRSRYSRGMSKEWLMFEANQMDALIQPTLVELGYQSPTRWQHISGVFTDLGMLPPRFDPSAIIYTPPQKGSYRLLAGSILVSGTIIAVLTGLILSFRRLNRRLSEEIVVRKQSEEERLRLERQFFHAQKLESLGVLAGGIAHDFNNILTAIVGNAELALLRLNPESPAVDNLHRIEHAAARATDLAKQMLAYSGKGTFVVEAVDMNRLVEEMTHMLEVSIGKKAQLRFNLTRPLPSVEADATQLRQIVMNLVINASEAIGDTGGVIDITTGCTELDRSALDSVWLEESLSEGRYVFLEISDSGCGMDDETRSRIFDPFFSTKFTGRGLGMAAALGIVRSHRGAIKVRSEVGKGSCFTILLPASRKPTAASSVAREDAWRGSGTVLLVDDEDTVRGVGSELLRELGFDVVTACDGREALEIYRQGSFDFVILDLVMPNLDGEQTFRELRSMNPGAKVIMSSGYSEVEVSRKFAGMGLAGFIQKPYRLAEMRNAVKRLE